VPGEFETAFDGEMEAIPELWSMQLTIKFQAISQFILMLIQKYPALSIQEQAPDYEELSELYVQVV
jgi:hypothetical protein